MRDWNDYQYLLALEEGGTMKHAAELLGTDPTTVSRHIKRISHEMGVMLFKMNKGGAWTITNEGSKLTARAKVFKQEIDGLNAGESSQTETVKITSIEFLLTHYLAPHAKEGLGCFPDTKLALLGSDKRLSLAYGEADLALRFGRPTEGQLIASRLGDIEFTIWNPIGKPHSDWIGLQEELDWTPEMDYALRYFKKPPLIRVTSYAAAKLAGESVGLPFIAPCAVMARNNRFEPMHDIDPIKRPLWSVIHETKRFDQRLAAVKNWAKMAVEKSQRFCEI